jgi:hypothetical protein
VVDGERIGLVLGREETRARERFPGVARSGGNSLWWFVQWLRFPANE